MANYKVIEIKQSVFSSNEKEANSLRKELKEKGTFLLNLMSSPGSGKTTTLTAVINALKDKLNIAVMEADIDGECDANTIEKKCGVEVVQLHTGGMCHLDADMTRQGLNSLEGKNIDLAILENVGNLVCPAEFDTGSSKNAMILSVPEGDDKPLKYPLMFTISDLVIINKIDTLSVFDFDIEKAKERILKLNKKATIIPISAKTGEGLEELQQYITDQFFQNEISFNQEIYLSNERQKQAVSEAYESLLRVKESYDFGMGEDFYTIDMMNAYEQLGSIIGETVDDDLVDTIFKKFCMGK